MKMQSTLLTVATLLSLGILAGCADREERENPVAFFTALEERYGVPTGKNPIDAQTAARRGISYRIETRDGKVRKVASVNGHGKPVLDEEGEKSIQIPEYNEDGTLRHLIFQNPSGERESIREFSDWKTHPDGSRAVRVLDGGIFQEWLFNPQGLTIEIRSINRAGNPRQTPIGQFEADRAGNFYQGDDESFDVSGIGLPRFAKTVIRRDEAGNPVETTYWSVDGQPTYGWDKFFRRTAVFDSHGNEIETRVWDVEGKPGVSSLGWHRRTMQFSPTGEPVERAGFGRDGRPSSVVFHPARDERDGVPEPQTPTVWRAVRDSFGNMVGELWLDAEGRPANNDRGFASVSIRLDPNGNILEKSLFDQNGKPYRGSEGWATWLGRYDADGNLCGVSFLGATGEPVLAQGGMAEILNTYDSDGNLVEQAFFGVKGEPIADSSGVARAVTVYDEKGFDLGQEFFGRDGKPMVGPLGFAKAVRKVDAQGNVLEESFFGPDGRPAPVEGYYYRGTGYCKIVRSYDAMGNVLEESFFDAEGKPFTTGYGFARRTARFDERGNQIEEAYFDAQKRPVVLSEAAVESPAPAQMRRPADPGGLPHLSPLRPVAKWTARHDENGLITERAFFDAEGRPLTVGQFGAKRIFAYDANGSIIEETIFMGDEKTTPYTQTKYDSQGRILEETTFAAGGVGILEKSSCKLSEDGRVLEATDYYFEGDRQVGNPVKFLGIRVTKYDAETRPVERAYFDHDNRPVECPSGFHREVFEFADSGRNPVKRVRTNLQGETWEVDPPGDLYDPIDPAPWTPDPAIVVPDPF